MILLDNIIFSLQPAGGISTLWNAILTEIKKSDINFEIADYTGRGTLSTLSRKILRYLPERTSLPQGSIFHSSYQRIHQSSKVANITTVHDFVYEKFDRGVRKHVHTAQKSYAIKRSTRIICVSENTKTDLIARYPKIAPNKVVVIPNGVSDQYLGFSKTEPLKTEPFLLFVGGRGVHKNFPICLRLLATKTAKEKNLKLIVVGGGPLSRADRDLAISMGVLERVHHRSNVNNTDLCTLYRSAYAFLYPSFYEGFGIPVLEAMASGCPTIAARASSIPEVAGDAARLIDPNSLSEAESALAELENASQRKHYVSMGQTRARQYPIKKTAASTIQLYRNLLGK